MTTATKIESQLENRILDLLSTLDLVSGHSSSYYEGVTAVLTKYFSVDRASIWLFSEDETSLICKAQFDFKSGGHASGQVLRAPDFSYYFKSLNDNVTHTVGLHQILDVPLKTSEQILGVVSLEQLENKRAWTNLETEHLKIVSLNIAKTLSSLLRIQNLEASLADEREKASHPIKMAHEINNPLTIILGNAYLLNSLAEEHEQNIELQKSSINKIVDAATRIDKIIRGIRFK